GKSRIYYKPSCEYDAVALVGLGKECDGYNKEEEIEEGRENVRVAAAVGAQSLQGIDCTHVFVEDFGDAEAAAEGVTLGLFTYQEWKDLNKRKKIPIVEGYEICDPAGWQRGIIKANAQNLARRLSDAPSNFMTPTKFAETANSELSCHGVTVTAHNKDWALDKKMGAFLSVAQGSVEPLKFLEMTYKGGSQGQNPIVLVGKGITFDTGGISLKPSNKMDEMRGDMGGAACVVATMQAIAALKIPINVIGLTPLCENMPSGHATKPGDIVTAMNGKNIIVDNTDAEGRLILADALCYAASFNPSFTLDIATLTGAMRVALGGVLTGVFTNSDYHWEELKKAGSITGDRVWRFPLYKEFTKRVTAIDYHAADVNNVGKGTGGGACTAAAFLKEFAPPKNWMHLDIAGVMGPDSDIPYLQKGMTGRPTRTLVEFLMRLACPS
ncbi:hypothetical protein AAG570_003218, partial [Ranatra chinensis]